MMKVFNAIEFDAIKQKILEMLRRQNRTILWFEFE